MRPAIQITFLTSALAGAAPSALGQSSLYTLDGMSKEDGFGYAVSGAGDVDGDGVGDVVVGAPWDDELGPGAGYAQVFSGVDGSVLYTFYGDLAGYYFGYSVSGAGDVNGDGLADVAIGIFGNNGQAFARVFSGADGSIVYTFHGAVNYFGRSISGAGDVDADGFDDVIVGAEDTAHVFSGANGTTLYTLWGDAPGQWFGYSVSGAGDVNADGFDDVIVGAPLDDTKFAHGGSARVHSGADGAVLYAFYSHSAEDRLGWSVSGAGDVNADGFDDVIVGASFDDTWVHHGGSARVYSGADGSVLHAFYGGEEDLLGYSVSGAGDVNGDGLADVVVGTPYENGKTRGSARVYWGGSGRLAFTLSGDSKGDRFGRSVSGVGDVDGDGFADVVVGAYRDDRTFKNAGSARLISGCDVCFTDGTRYCDPANLNSTGASASIAANGSLLVADDWVTLTAEQMPPDELGHFLCSTTQGFVPFPGGSQGNLCLGGAIGRYVRAGEILDSGAAGSFSLPLALGGTPQPTGPVAVQPGETWSFQAWFTDTNPGPTSNFTNATSVTFR